MLVSNNDCEKRAIFVCLLGVLNVLLLCVCAHAHICMHARLHIHHSIFVAVRVLAGTGSALLYVGPWDQTHMVRPVTSITTSWEISLTPGCLLTAMRTFSY